MVTGMGSRTFVGTHLSTFSNYIIKLRNKARYAHVSDAVGLLPRVGTLPEETFNGEDWNTGTKGQGAQHKHQCDWHTWTRWEDIIMSDHSRAYCHVEEALNGSDCDKSRLNNTKSKHHRKHKGK
jgi:hypothetical protein